MTRPFSSKRIRRGLYVEPLEARELPATLFVATTGSDSSSTGSVSQPFLSIQHAVTEAHSGDLIKVAAGDYGYNAAADSEGSYTKNFGTTSVVTLYNKALTIIGGYTTGDWGTYNPSANVTAIDGGNLYRGILVVGGTSTTALDFRGFTVAHGLARGIPARGGSDAIDAFGGGMFVDIASVGLTDVIFSQNRAIGNDTSGAIGGSGAGGGLAFRSSSNATVGGLTNVSFIGNIAVGGAGASRGGFGQGGGLFTYQYTVTGTNLTFTNNYAIGGSTAGGGVGSGDRADGQGGGLAIHIRSVATLSHVNATGNQAVGGAAPNGDAGGAYGGGVYAEFASLSLSDSTIQSNAALGGNGNNGGSSAAGFANGGGLMTTNSTTSINRSSVLTNTAIGGNGAVYKGVSGGGGIALVSQPGSSLTASINDSVIADNAVIFGTGTDASRGGGGGGIWLDGPTTFIAQSTIAENQLTTSDPTHASQLGQGILVGPSTPTTLNLSYNIIANHQNVINGGNGFAAALSLQAGSTANLNRNLFADNSNDTNASGFPSPAGTYSGSGTNVSAASVGFVSAGAPLYNYRLSPGSAAVNAATGSTETLDLTGQSRIGIPDLGAYELRVQISAGGDYAGVGRSQLAVYRPTTTQWLVEGVGVFGPFGSLNLRDAIPVPGDYDGTGHTELAYYVPSTAQWFVQGHTQPFAQFGWAGLSHDIPVPGDYDGTGHTEIAVYRPSTSQWFVQGHTQTFAQFGWSGLNHDIPVPGDYDGTGHTEIAVYRPSTAQWFVQGHAQPIAQFGWAGLNHDLPVAGDYDGTGHSEVAVFRPSTGEWFVLGPNGSHSLGTFGATNLFDVPLQSSVGSLVALGLVGGGISGSSISTSASPFIVAPNAVTSSEVSTDAIGDVKKSPTRALHPRFSFESTRLIRRRHGAVLPSLKPALM